MIYDVKAASLSPLTAVNIERRHFGLKNHFIWKKVCLMSFILSFVGVNLPILLSSFVVQVYVTTLSEWNLHSNDDDDELESL